MPLAEQLAELYDAHYFAHCLGEHAYERSEVWLNFFRVVATRICDDLNPKMTIDVGCASGMLVEQLWALDIDAWGFDVSEYALSQVPEALRARCWRGSAAEPAAYAPMAHYDLATCVEVVEHMPPQEADYAIGLMCQRARAILFSSSPDDYDEPTHINVRPVHYWAHVFARHSFYHDLDFDASFVSRWAMLFRPAVLQPSQLVWGYERKLWLLQRQVLTQRGIILQHAKDRKEIP